MAINNVITAQLKLVATGIKEAIQGTGQVHQNLKGANVEAEKLGKQKPYNASYASGGTAGSRAVAAKAAPTGSQTMSGTEYGNLRGSAGTTGASARDFANQAQGLGGLVRLYATYAANIFAVSAAFRALSNAIDTANMVKGLDQLGASSGVALGSLSKNLAKATGGAISLREAMEATAKASSSGMSSDQIIRMGKVAQQASQALGVDMSDAISRISRGITKLEPELLDELGLFTKTGMAAEAYAKSVGKSTSELTDFERRAAFANAVLAEGERKFSSINLDVNPYTKLLASIKDLAQVSLEFVNKGLAPIVSYLSNSPTALGVAIAALGSVLVKQALPAIGEFKAGLASAAEGANQLAIRKAEDAGKARLAIDADILKKVEAMADDKVAAVDAAEQKIQALEASNINKRSAAYKLLQKDIEDVTDADISAVEARAKAAEKAGDLRRAAAYREVTSAVMEHKKAEEDLIVTKQQLSKQLEKDATSMTTYGMTVRAAEQAQTAATKANIVSNAAYNGSLIGTTAAMAMMRTEMQAAGIATNTFSGKLLLARGALMAFAGQVSTLMAALGPIMLIITGISLAFSLLDGALSSNSKEAAELSNALNSLDSNTQHFGKTIDAINEKPFLERMSPDSLKVKATALAEVSTAISSTVKGLISADKAASGWDKFIDGWKTLWDGDILSKASKGLTAGIIDSLASISGSPEAKAINKELSSILKIDTETASFQEIQDAIKKIGRESPEKLKLVEEGFKKVSMAAQVSAAKGTELVDSFKKLADIKQTISNKFLPTDDITKFGQELVATSQKLSIALNDPQQKLNAIVSLAANGVNIPGATLEQVSALTEAAKLAKSIQDTEARQLDNKQKLIDKEAELAKLVGKEKAAAIAAGKQVQVYGLTLEGQKDLKELKKDLQAIKTIGNVNIKVKTELTAKLDEYSEIVQKANLDTFKAGADLVAKQINAEFIKAGKVVSDAYTSIIGETEGTIKLRSESEKAVISAQIEQIKSQRDLTIATRELSLRLEKETLEKQAGLSKLDREAVAPRLSEVNKGLVAVEAAKSGDFSKLNLSTNVNDLKTLNVEANNFANNMRSSAAAIANLGAQIKAIDIKALDATTKLLFETAKTALGEKEKSISLSKQELDIQGKVVSQGNMSYIAAKNAVEGKVLALQQEVALLNIAAEIARNVAILNSNASKDVKKEASAKITLLHIDIERLATQQAQQKGILAATQAQEKLAAQAFNAEEARKREQEILSLTLAKKDEHLKREQDLFNLYSSIGVLTETSKVNQQFLLDKKKAELEYEQKIAAVKASQGSELGSLDTRESLVFEQISAGTGDYSALVEELKKIDELKARINTRTNEEISAAGRARDNIIGIAGAVKAAATEQLVWNDSIATLNSTIDGLSESLLGLGTKFSEALSGVVSTIGEVTIAQLESKKAIENTDKAAKIAYDAGRYEDYFDLMDEGDKKRKKAEKDEITGTAKILGASKKLFKEKTAAYKVLDATEKAMHAAKMAMFMEERMADFIKTAETVANAVVRMFASKKEAVESGKAAVVEQGKGEPLSAFARMAAMAAFVASILGSSSAASAPSVPEPSIAEGTGTVLGDKNAKSKTVANSIEILQDTDPILMRNSNSMLRHLKSIDDGIAQFGVAIARSLVGKSINESVFNTEFGTKGLGGSNILGSALGFLKIGTTTKLMGEGLSIPVQKMADIFMGNFTAEWFQSIRKSQFIGGYDYSRLTSPIEGSIETALFKTFSNVGKFVQSGAETLGIDVTEALNNYKLNIGDINLTGTTEEKQQKLEEVVGASIDTMIETLIPGISDFAKVNEGLGETLARVAYGTDYATSKLEYLGISAINYTDIINKQGDIGTEILRQSITNSENILASAGDTSSAYISELVNNFTGSAEELYDLYVQLDTTRTNISDFGFSTKLLSDEAVKASGSLGNLSDNIANFYENFASEAQQTALNVNRVTKLFTDLGLVIPDTREGMFDLVTALSEVDPKSAAILMSSTSLLDTYYDTLEEGSGSLQAMIDIIKESVQLTSSSLSSMFKDIIKTANSSAEAYTMAQTKASQMMYDSVVDMALNAVGKLVFDAVIQPVADYAIRAATQAATTTVTGSTTSAAVLVAGGTLAGEALANVITKATGIISTMAAVLNDPTFQGMVSNLSGTIGTIAATSYTSTKNTSISGGYSYGGGSSAGNVDNILNTLKDGISSVGREISKLDMNAYEAALSDINYQTSQYISQLVEAGQATAGNIALARQWGAAQVSLLDAKNLREANNIFKGMNTELTNLTTTTTPLSQKISAINSQTTEYVNRLESLGQATAGNVNKVNDWAAAMIAATKAASLAEAGTIVLGLETEVAELGMSELEKQLSSVSTRSTGYITQLTSLGMTLEDATLAVNTWSSAIVNNINTTEQSRISKELSDNSKSASDMLKGLASEVSKLGMTDLEIELYGISTQTQDYLDQLNELGQATTENISAVMAWSNAMRENTIAAKARESDEKAQNAILELTGDTTGNLQSKFDTLQDKFSALGLSVPSTASSFANLISQINVSTTAGRNLRDSLVELVPAFNEVIEGVSSILRQSFEERQNELISSIDKFKEFATSIKEFKRSLILGELSPLTPQQKYEKAQQDFISISSLAQQGDVDAIAKLSTVSESYLQASQAMNASSQQYIDDFNTVLGILDSTESVAELQMHTATDTLAEVRNTVSQLISIDSSINTVNTSIIGLGTALTGAISLFSSITGVEAVSYDANSYSLPQFAVGTNFVPEDMVAQIHKGERIIPAADNLKLEQALNSNNDENLLQELRLLNKKIESLEATVAEGASMNVKATNRNTEEVSNSVKEASSKSVFATKLERKVSLT